MIPLEFIKDRLKDFKIYGMVTEIFVEETFVESTFMIKIDTLYIKGKQM